MKKILNMSEPKISIFPIYGFVLSILPEDKAEPWIYNAFIQLRYLDCEHVLFFEMYRSLIDGCPYINRTTIERKQIEKYYDDIFLFIENMIFDNKYIFFHVDRYYLSFFNEYHKNHIWHELLIFGFDKKNNIFYCADNGPDGKFCHFTCSYQEFLEAYNGIDSLRVHMDTHILEVVNWWNEEDDFLRMDQIYSLLEAYYYSRANIVFSEPFRSVTYGLNAHYKVLEDVKESQDLIDVRAICLLLEHKKMMKERFRYIYNFQSIAIWRECFEFYEQLQKKYQVLRNMMLKYNLLNSGSLEINDIVNAFRTNIELEEKFRDDNFAILKERFELCRKGEFYE